MTHLMIQPLLLSGGSGTRLWPLSREQYPKQILALTDERSLFQAAALRMDGAMGNMEVAAQVLVVCNEEHRFLAAEQLRQVDKTAAAIVLEPAGRNTAPALALGAHAALAGGADPLLLVMSADHVVRDEAAFRDAIRRGVDKAAAGGVVVFGIVPDRPETGYGYIQAERSLNPVPVSRFVEKPDAATAEAYVASGEYFWNSGIFLMRASTWIRALGRYRPDILDACDKAYGSGRRDGDFFRVDAPYFLACPSDSIDYAVMERLPADAQSDIGISVVSLSCGWSDVGAWESLWQVADKDGAGNAARGDVLLEDTRGSLVFAEHRMVACVGMDDVVVVETPDAVLVADKSRTQDLRRVVDRLKADKRSEAQAHRRVHRPWGTYDSIDHGERFQVKRIVVKPGAKLSLQMHHHRAEHWIVVRGTARVTRDEEEILLTENQSTYIPLGARHCLENPGKVPLEIIEIQSGAYLGEDDIVRFEDAYGRA